MQSEQHKCDTHMVTCAATKCVGLNTNTNHSQNCHI